MPMALEILWKPMSMFRTEYDLVPTGVAIVWTVVRFEIILPSGIARWRVVGGLYAGHIVYISDEDKNVFMVASPTFHHENT